MREYFSFTKKERVAVIALVTVILAAYFLPDFIKPEYKKPSANEVAEFKALEQQLVKAVDSFHTKSPPPPERLFYFDPNTLSAEGWKQLGLRAKTIGTIEKFISKGGRFHEPGDLKKIYGLHAEEYERLVRYIRIPVKKVISTPQQRITYEKNPRAKIIVDINEADTAAFVALPGIGSKLAARIVAFREKLGGFYSIEQIAETYGLPDSTYQMIKPLLTLTNPRPRKINFNTATLEMLRQHPYIRWNLANAIVRYREQHGPFKSLEELLQLAPVTPEIYRRIFPYGTLAEPE
jgi:competence protein ComEA